MTVSKYMLESKVMAEIRPTCDEEIRIKKTAKRLMGMLDKHLSRGHHGFKLSLEGSVAKETNLHGSSDIDLFVLLEEPLTNGEIKLDVLPHIAGALMELELDVRQEYASHPYLSTVMNGCNVDIVPATEIDDIEDMYTAVDRTPLHTRWVNDNLTPAQKMNVRVFKQFLKNHGIYGSSEEVEGFSGYLCEVLVHIFGSFWLLVAELDELNWVPDPVDPNRNVAAAVSRESMSKFMDVCIDLQTDLEIYGSEEILKRHFFRPDLDVDDTEEIQRALNIYGSRHFQVYKEELGEKKFSQFAKGHRRKVASMGERGYEVIQDCAFATDHAFYSFVELSESFLPMYRIVRGPYVGMNKAKYSFMDAHEHVFRNGARYYARESVKNTMFKENYPFYSEAKMYLFLNDQEYERKLMEFLGI